MSQDPLAPPTSISGHSAKTDAAYRQALSALFARTTGAWRLGLERVSGFLERLGTPHLQYPVFHVAGTNGKGSTIATLDAILQGNGLRVGRYTSPHLVDFRERIVINGTPMAPEAIVAFLERWDPQAAQLGTTFFEVTTAMALAYFAEQNVDVAVIEVGLGGRLDATNVVKPISTGVTQIGFDHTEYLGNSLGEIAGEKAGIFKRNVPAIVGDSNREVQQMLIGHAEQAGATPILTAEQDWRVTEVGVDRSGTSFTLDVDGMRTTYHTPLLGSFQAQNAAVALAMLRGAGGRWADMESTASSHLANVRIAGRFHRVGRYIFDVAHNPDGAATIANNVRALGMSGSIVAVLTVLRDKDWRGILEALSTVVEQFVLTCAPTAPESRAWNADEVLEWCNANGITAVLERDFDAAIDRANAMGATTLITGSFHTVGDAMERLQVDPLAR